MQSFVVTHDNSGQEKVPKWNSGPLFDYLLKVQYGSPAVNIAIVKKYIAESPVDFVHPKFGNYTALFIVAQSTHLTEEIVDLLLDAGYNKEAVDSYGKTPLLEALNNNNVAIAKRLIERGANIHFAAPSANALCFAVNSDNVELMQMLLEIGVDVNFVAKSGNTVLNEAMSNGNIEITKFLLTQKIQPITLNSSPEKPFFSTPLCSAVSSDNLEFVNMVLEAGADVNNYGEDKLTPLALALWRRELPIVNRLFEVGAKPSNLPVDELFMAARNKVPEAIEKLVKLGADIKKTYEGRSLVTIAMDPPNLDTGNEEHMTSEQHDRGYRQFEEALKAIGDTVKLLGKYGLDFNTAPAEDPTLIPLLQAQNIEVFKIVESLGASLTVVIEGSTLLHLMTGSVQAKMLEYVLQKGVIDVNSKNSEGLTALHLSCRDFNPPKDLAPTINVLIKYKADINALNDDAQTPLMYALAQQNLKAALSLVCAGAKLDVKDKNGNNLMHIACSIQDTGEKFLEMITKYADIESLKKWMNEMNGAGDTPAQVAKKSSNEGLSLLLNGDLVGAISKGVLISEFAKLHPEAFQKLELGYECHEVDTSKYDFNTGQTSSLFKLANETVALILVRVNTEDLASFSMACRQCKRWSDNRQIWKVHLKREYETDSKTQSPKKELAVRWRAQVNMRKGIFLSRTLSLDPDIETPAEMERYANPFHVGVKSMAFDIESGTLFVGDLKWTIFCVDVKKALINKTFRIAQVFQEFEGNEVKNLTVVPEDKILLYNMGSGRLLARNYETGQEREISAACRDFRVSGDFALTSNFSTFGLYNWKTGENVWTFVEGNNSAFSVLLQDNIAVTGTGATSDTKVRFWDIKTMAKFAESERQGYATYLSSGKKYAIGTAMKSIACFEIATGKSLWRHQNAHTYTLISHAAIDESSMIVVSVATSELIAWDLLTGKKIAILSQQDDSGSFRQCLSIAIKGHLVFAGIWDKKSAVEVWDVRRPQAPLYVVPLTAGPKCLIVKDHYVLVGLMNNSVKIINFNL